MEIETNLRVQATTAPSAGTRKNYGVTGDFLAAVNAAAKSEVPRETISETASIYETDPVELYQDITGRTVTREGEIPSFWTDEALATLITRGEGGISTEKTINWFSQGDQELTAEQVARLKEKYDVTNLSSQGYYDLMSDLTHMGVLSGEDCMGVHLRTAPAPGPGQSFMFHPAGYSAFPGAGRGFNGNLLGSLSLELDILLEHLAWLGSTECRKMNAHLTTEQLSNYQGALEKDIKPRQRLMELLKQLQ